MGSSWTFGVHLPRDTTTPRPRGRSAFPEPGELFGAYRILGTLGEGGNGVVYRAEDPAKRKVALKILKGRLDSSGRARFRREGEVAASLDHPGILRVFAGGEEGGQPFLVYELVEDVRELDVHLRDLDLQARVRLLHRVAEALGYAHARGVVHRDLKASNVLVDNEGRVRVADFGLAKAEGAEGLTQTGAILGTPTTMSPEQIVGDLDRIGPPTDVWALGVMLYEAICDMLPFCGGSFLELQVHVVAADPERPADVVPGLSLDLESICLKALSKEPRDRYANGAEIAADLAAYLAGKRPSSSTSSPWLSPAFARRRLYLALPVLLTALVCLAAVTVTLRGAEERELQRKLPADSVLEAAVPDPLRNRSDRRRAREAQRAFEALRRRRKPEDQRASAETWLERFGGRPQRAEVEVLLDQALWSLPLEHQEQIAIAKGGTWRVRFVGPRRLVVYGEYGSKGAVSLYDLQTGASPREIDRWELPAQEVDEVIVLSEDRLLARCTPGGPFWCLRDQKPTRIAGWTRDFLKSSRAIALLETLGGEATLIVGDLGSVIAADLDPAGKVVATRALAWPDENWRAYLVAAIPDGFVVTYHVVNAARQDQPQSYGVLVYSSAGELIRETRLDSPVSWIEPTPDGACYVIGSETGVVERRSTADDSVSQSFLAKDDAGGFMLARAQIYGLALAPRGFVLSVESGVVQWRTQIDDRLVVWSPSGKVLQTVPLAFAPESVAVSPDGRWVAMGSREGNVHLWRRADP